MTALTPTTPSASGENSPHPDTPQPLYYIYGRHSSQRRFRPMDLREGRRVVNLLFASRLTAAQADRFSEVEAPRNTDWTFKRRRIPIPRKHSGTPPPDRAERVSGTEECSKECA